MCGFFKGIFTTVPTFLAQRGKLLSRMKQKLEQWSEWWSSNVYPNFLSLSSTWQFFFPYKFPKRYMIGT